MRCFWVEFFLCFHHVFRSFNNPTQCAMNAVILIRLLRETIDRNNQTVKAWVYNVLRFLFRLNAIRTKATWNEPKISFHHALGFGSFKGKEQHNIDFQSMDNRYFETGLILDGIFSSRTIGLGLGVFYNYGFYAAPDWKMNIVPKFAMSINLW